MRIASGGNAELSSVERPLRAELSSVERPLGLGARTERRRVLGLLVLGGSLVLALDRTAWPQDFCRPTESETQEPAQLLAKTANFAVGRIDAFEGGVTDLTFREEGPASQVLATDPVAAENVTSFSADLALKGGLIAPDTTLDVYGIASIPFGLREGASYVIDPGWIFTGTWPPNDGGFFPQLVSTPRIGVMNENGVVLEPFSDVVGLALDER